LLNWQPTVPLQEGLKLTVEDFRTRIASAEAYHLASM